MRRLALTLLLPLVLLAGACGTSGRALQAPEENATAPPRRTSSTLAATTTTVVGLNLFTNAFTVGGRIPTEFTCDGAGISPPLSWTGVAAGTKELALVVTDTEDGSVQWLVTGIPTSTTGAVKATPPAGGTQQANSFGSTGWKAPCPASGVHVYEFELLAFAQQPLVDTSQDAKAQARALQQLAGNSAAFTGSFGR